MKLLVKRGDQVTEMEIGRVIKYGDADWVDPESPEFDRVSDRSATYQLKPKPNGASA